MAVSPRRCVAFDLATGDRIAPVPGDFDFEIEVNDYGSIKLVSEWTQEAIELKSWQRTTAMRTILAIIEGDEVICAGPITDRDPRIENFTLNAASSMWRFFEERLALNSVLQEQFSDGLVLVDEENPSPEWLLVFRGSLADIGGELIKESLKWGRLPVTVQPFEGGTAIRTYKGWEMHTVASRLKLLTGVINGPEIRFKPSIREDGGITFEYQAAPELIDRVHNWNAIVPESRVYLIRVPEDATKLATEAWGFGGRSDDVVLMARARSSTLVRSGYPVIQKALTGLDSVTELDTLQDHVEERVSRSIQGPGVFEFKVGIEKKARPGDWANVRIDDPAYGKGVVPLKILRVESDGFSEYDKVYARRRENGL